MSQDKVLLIAGDTALGERVSRFLMQRGVDTHVVGPADDVSPEGLFDVAFERQSTAVILIEPLDRGDDAVALSDALLAASLRAARSPMVSGFGWVTSREGSEALAEFRQKGKPYGVLRLGNVIRLMVEEGLTRGPEKQVLISADLSSRVAEDGAVSLEGAAQQVAAWVERDGHRGGGETSPSSGSQPLEEAVRESGFAPLTLPRWRVSLNRMLGMLVVDDRSHPLTIRRTRFFRAARTGLRSSPGEVSATA